MSSGLQSLKLWGFGTQWGVTVEIPRKLTFRNRGAWERRCCGKQLWQEVAMVA